MLSLLCFLEQLLMLALDTCILSLMYINCWYSILGREREERVLKWIGRVRAYSFHSEAKPLWDADSFLDSVMERAGVQLGIGTYAFMTHSLWMGGWSLAKTETTKVKKQQKSKTKVNWINFKILLTLFNDSGWRIGSIFLAHRKELWVAVQKERLLLAEESGNKEVILVKSGLVVRRSLCFRGWHGSVRHINSLVWSGNSRLTGLRFHFLEKPKLLIKSWFGVSILGPIVFLILCNLYTVKTPQVAFRKKETHLW